MTLTPAQLKPDASRLPLEQVATSSHLDPKQKIAESARQFEALLLRQILGETRKTVLPSKFAPASVVNSIYSDLINESLADSISRSGMLGLARNLRDELTFQTQRQTPAPTSHAAARTSTPARHD